jgi:hypothetical protein
MLARRPTIVVLLCALAVLATGCDSSTTSNPEINARLEIDDAFVTVAPLQNDAAIAYSQAILKTTDDPQIKQLADDVIKRRQTENEKFDKLQKNYHSNGAPTPQEAADTLDTTLEKLAITAAGKPLAAPSSDSAYLKALEANLKGSLVAINADIDGGGPGTVPFAKEMLFDRTSQLEKVNGLQ